MSTQNAAALNETFAILDHVRFSETPSGLTQLLIQTPHATAAIYTHGAHLTAWQPAGEQPGIYLSPKAVLQPGKAIRGGIPVIFPWFGAYTVETFGPQKEGVDYGIHGFARISEWTVEMTHFSPDGDVTVEMALEANDLSRSFGFDRFRCVMRFVIGKQLSITLEVTNKSADPLTVEEGMHTYFAVGDARQATVEGLQGTDFYDKRQDFKRLTQTDKLLHFTRDVDQVHVNTTSALTIHDNTWKRDIAVDKEGSSATVCWNPWTTLTPGFSDLASDSWEHFVCVEAVNAMENKITIAPGATHTLNCTIGYTPQASQQA